MAQAQPPAEGYKLHRVRRLKPAPLPPGGLVPYDDYFTWGLSDTLGRVYVRPEFENELNATTGPFWRSEWGYVEASQRRSDRWKRQQGEWEIWVNARGQFLAVPGDFAAYRQPDGSLVAKPLRRHLTAPLYRFESALDTATRGRRYWHNWPQGRGWVYALATDLFAVRGPSGPRYFRQVQRRNHRHPVPHPPSAYGPAQALFDSTSRRLTPYRYDRLLPISNGRIRFERYAAPRTYGYLDRRGREVLGPYDAAGPFSHGRAVVVRVGNPTPNAEQYALIDTTGAYVLAPQPRRLDGPDALGFVRRALPRPGKGNVAEYLRLDGQPAFPGRYFGWGEEFKADSAAVPDTLGRPGILYADGRWRPRSAPAKPAIRPEPRPAVQAAPDGRFRLIKSDGQPLNAETYAWAKALAGNWFAARAAADAPTRLLTPAGQVYPLPPGYEPDLTLHGVDNVGEVPFAHGLLKVRWGKPFREGEEPRREAYLTRGGRVLSRDLSTE